MYKNKIYFTILTCGGIREYLVTLKLDDTFYNNTEGEMRVFETEQEARQCFQSLIPYKHVSPPTLLEKFKTYV